MGETEGEAGCVQRVTKGSEEFLPADARLRQDLSCWLKDLPDAGEVDRLVSNCIQHEPIA